jgi:uracil-DNA glycosylase
MRTGRKLVSPHTVLHPDDRPRSMRDVAVRERRKAMLCQPHIEPLTAFAARLRKSGVGEVPEFDPLDGGVNARVLFLFEKPGPMTARPLGSGFISRNNDDPTAEATFAFMQRAGMPRELTVTWNLIPSWNGTRKIAPQELRDGVKYLAELITLLPKLRAVVLVGQHAAKVAPRLKEKHPGLRAFTSAHPSPLVRARFPDRWNAIPSEWAKVLKRINDTEAPVTNRRTDFTT